MSSKADASAAIALARRCVEADPAGYRSIWGTPLEFDRATAWQMDSTGTWIVSIPEVAPRGVPSGLDLEVDLATGAVVELPVE
jgi:hypothetical protein